MHSNLSSLMSIFFFLFNDTATTEIYTLSLHDALPICGARMAALRARARRKSEYRRPAGDRKSTRLNSSHANISYAVFCLKTKKDNPTGITPPNNTQTTPTTQQQPHQP